MSANWYTYNFYFKNSSDLDRFKENAKDIDDSQIIKLISNGESILEEKEHLEGFGFSEKSFQISLQTSTSCDLNDRLILAFKRLGSEFVHVDVFYDQVGEREEFHIFRGEPVYEEEADELILEYGLPPSLEKILENDNVRLLNQLISEGMDPNIEVDGDKLVFETLRYSAVKIALRLLELDVEIEPKDDEELSLLFRIFEDREPEFIPVALTIIEKGVDLQQKDYEGNSLLWQARTYDDRVAQALEEQGAECAYSNDTYEDESPSNDNLRTAIIHNDKEMIAKEMDLLKAEEVSEFSYYAAEYNRADVYRQLLDKGLQPEDSEDFDTALSYASYDILNLIIDLQEDQNEFLLENADSILSYLAEKPGSLPLIRKVLEAGFSPESNEHLFSAIRKNQLEVASALLESGAPINEEDCEPLVHEVLDRISAEGLRLLIDNGAEPLCKNLAGKKLIERIDENDLQEGVREVLLSLQNNLPDEQKIWGAIKDDELESVTQFWNSLPNKNIQNELGQTLLTFAAACGSNLSVEYLIQSGASIEGKNELGNTPLAEAIANKKVDLAKHLLVLKADPNVTVSVEENAEEEFDEDDKKFMSMMGLDGMEELAELEKLASEYSEVEGNDSSCLMFACNYGLLDLVESLIEAGADIEFQDEDKSTAIFYSVNNGHLETTKYLVDKGADYKTTSPETLLHTASLRGKGEIIDYLIELGLDINNQDAGDDYTPLHTAITTAAFNGPETVSQLIKAGVDINKLAHWKTSPLILATQLKISGVEKILLEAGADTNIIDGDAKTAFDYAKEYEDEIEDFDISELIPNDPKIAAKKRVAEIKYFIYWRLIPLIILFFVLAYFSTNVAYVVVGSIAAWIIYGKLKKTPAEEPAKPTKQQEMLGSFLDVMEKASEENERREKEKKAVRANWEDSSETEVGDQKVESPSNSEDWIDWLIKKSLLSDYEQANTLLENSGRSIESLTIEDKLSIVVNQHSVSINKGQFESESDYVRLFSGIASAVESYVEFKLEKLEISTDEVNLFLSINGEAYQINVARKGNDLPPKLVAEIRKCLKQFANLGLVATDPMAKQVAITFMPWSDMKEFLQFSD